MNLRPVEYLEHRVKVLQAERPLTPAGVDARDAAIRELEHCIEVINRDILARLGRELDDLKTLQDAIHLSPLAERIQ